MQAYRIAPSDQRRSSGPSSDGRGSREAGFTLIEVLVAMSLVVFLAALFAAELQTSQTGGQKAYLMLTKLAEGLQRMKLDMPCYPDNTAALFKSAAATSARCGNMSAQWKGPYAATTQVDPTESNVVMADAGANAVVTLGQGANLDGSGNATQFYLQVSNLPQETYNSLLTACNGNDPAGGPKNSGIRPCIGASGATGNTVQYIFDASRN